LNSLWLFILARFKTQLKHTFSLTFRNKESAVLYFRIETCLKQVLF
jgi:hypothetical protein